MNIQNLPLMSQSLSHDYHRLVELCSSYGLNEEQTDQIINDFKNGSFAQADQSIDESFQNSVRKLESPQHKDRSHEGPQQASIRDYDQQKSHNRNQGVSVYSENSYGKNVQRSMGEEYSFKTNKYRQQRQQIQHKQYRQKRQKRQKRQHRQHRQQRQYRQNGVKKQHKQNNERMENRQKKQKTDNQFKRSQKDAKLNSILTNVTNQESRTDRNQNNLFNPSKIAQALFNSLNLTEFLKNQRLQFQNFIQKKQFQENKMLISQLKEKDQQISELQRLKLQDSQIIIGLKNSVVSLSNLLQDRDQYYQTLQDKYQRLKLQNENISTQKSSKVQLNHQQSLTCFQERKSVLKDRQRQKIGKQNSLSEQIIRKLQSKENQKYSKLVRPNSNTIMQRMHTDNGRQSNLKKDDSKRSRIDINKYKGMIEKLRGSYQIR